MKAQTHISKLADATENYLKSVLKIAYYAGSHHFPKIKKQAVDLAKSLDKLENKKKAVKKTTKKATKTTTKKKTVKKSVKRSRK